MKKGLFYLLIFTSFFLFYPTTYASTVTYPRTEEDFLVPADVQVTESNKMDILNTPAVNASEKLYDFAELFSDSEEGDLIRKIQEYSVLSRYDLAIVTTNNLNGFVIGDYTNNFYDYNDFQNEGIILVIYIGGLDPQIYMGTSALPTSELQKIYSDARIHQTLAYIYKDIKDAKYYNAVDNYIKIVKGFFELDNDKQYVVDGNGNLVKQIPWIEIVILASTLSFIIVILLINRLKKYNVVQYSDNIETKLDPTSIRVSITKDEQVDRVLSKAK